MIRSQTQVIDNSRAVESRVKKAKFEHLRHAALSIRKDASKSIKQRKNLDKSSPEGTPPHQHKPGFLKRALWAHFDDIEAYAGFRFSRVDTIAATHEHGLTEDGRDYPERPTMAPALDRAIDRFHRDWRASI